MNKDELNTIEYYTVEQVAKLLQIHWQTVLQYIKTKELEAFKLGKGYRITRQDLEKFIEKKKKQGEK